MVFAVSPFSDRSNLYIFHIEIMRFVAVALALALPAVATAFGTEGGNCERIFSQMFFRSALTIKHSLVQLR